MVHSAGRRLQKMAQVSKNRVPVPTKNTPFVVTVKLLVMIDPPQFRTDSITLQLGAVNNKFQENMMEYQACDVFICWKG